MELKRFPSISVLSVFLFLGFIYYVTVYILEDWLSLQSSAGSLNTLIFTFLASLSAFSFCVCAFTDPGGVPSSYVPDAEEDQISLSQIKIPRKKNYKSFVVLILYATVGLWPVDYDHKLCISEGLGF